MGGQWVCVTYGGTMGDIWGGTMGVRVRETCTSASEYMFCFVFSNMYPFSPYVTPHSPHISEFFLLHLCHCEAHTGRVELRDELVDLGGGGGMGVGVVGWGDG